MRLARFTSLTSRLNGDYLSPASNINVFASGPLEQAFLPWPRVDLPPVRKDIVSLIETCGIAKSPGELRIWACLGLQPSKLNLTICLVRQCIELWTHGFEMSLRCEHL